MSANVWSNIKAVLVSEKDSVHHRKGCELVDKEAASKYRPFPQIDKPHGDFDFVLLITAQFNAQSDDVEGKRIIIGYAIVYEEAEVEISKLVFSQKMRIKRTIYPLEHLLHDAISKSLEVLVARFESFVWFCGGKTGNDKCPVISALESIKETTLFIDTKFKTCARSSNSKGDTPIKTIPAVRWGDMAHRSCFYKPAVPDSSTYIKEPEKTMTLEEKMLEVDMDINRHYTKQFEIEKTILELKSKYAAAFNSFEEKLALKKIELNNLIVEIVDLKELKANLNDTSKDYVMSEDEDDIPEFYDGDEKYKSPMPAQTLNPPTFTNMAHAIAHLSTYPAPDGLSSKDGSHKRKDVEGESEDDASQSSSAKKSARVIPADPLDETGKEEVEA